MRGKGKASATCDKVTLRRPLRASGLFAQQSLHRDLGRCPEVIERSRCDVLPTAPAFLHTTYQETRHHPTTPAHAHPPHAHRRFGGRTSSWARRPDRPSNPSDPSEEDTHEGCGVAWVRKFRGFFAKSLNSATYCWTDSLAPGRDGTRRQRRVGARTPPRHRDWRPREKRFGRTDHTPSRWSPSPTLGGHLGVEA